jgi:hypothetical protein
MQAQTPVRTSQRLPPPPACCRKSAVISVRYARLRSPPARVRMSHCRPAIIHARAALVPLVHGFSVWPMSRLTSGIMRCRLTCPSGRAPQYSRPRSSRPARPRRTHISSIGPRQANARWPPGDKTNRHHQQIEGTGHQLQQRQAPRPRSTRKSHPLAAMLPPTNKNTPDRTGVFIARSTLTVLTKLDALSMQRMLMTLPAPSRSRRPSPGSARSTRCPRRPARPRSRGGRWGPGRRCRRTCRPSGRR